MKEKDKFCVINKYIPSREVGVIFEKASVVVLPYREASQSGVIPIAYAFGKPVVATRVGSIPEVVKDGKTGILVPPEDPDALAEAIIFLLKNEVKRKEMGKEAKNYGEEELSWDKAAKKTFLLYKKLIGG